MCHIEAGLLHLHRDSLKSKCLTFTQSPTGSEKALISQHLHQKSLCRIFLKPTQSLSGKEKAEELLSRPASPLPSNSSLNKCLNFGQSLSFRLHSPIKSLPCLSTRSLLLLGQYHHPKTVPLRKHP